MRDRRESPPGTFRIMGVCLLAAALCALAATLNPAPAAAQSLSTVPFGGQDFDRPFYLMSPPGDRNRVFVVEGPGRIRVVVDGQVRPQPFLDISDDVLDSGECGGECGLSSMAFPPDYAETGRFYVFYTRDDPTPGEEYHLRVEEMRRSAADPDVAELASRRIVLEIPHLDSVVHNGGQLQFGPDGLLYISTGDGGANALTAQDLTSPLGKLLRIDPRGDEPFEYAVPADNPFADGPGGQVDEVYAYGLRNPFRFSFDRGTGDIVIADVGGSQREEINYAAEGEARGLNYGWPCFEGTATNFTSGVCSVPLEDSTFPAFEYAHATMGSTAIVGGYVVRDARLPQHVGRYLYSDSFGTVPGIRSIHLTPGGASGDAEVAPEVDFPISFGQDGCARLYVTSLGGEVHRIDPPGGPAGCKPAPALALSMPGAARAARWGRFTVEVGCDEDCTVGAEAQIRVKRAKRRKAFTVTATPQGGGMEIGQRIVLELALPAAGARRVRRALKRKRRAVATVSVTSRGFDGGRETTVRQFRQKR